MVGFKLTSALPPERFKNLAPAVLSHTIIFWDVDEAYFWCEKHHKYFEENESCPQCLSEQSPADKPEVTFNPSYRMQQPTDDSFISGHIHLLYKKIRSTLRRKS